MRGSTISGYVIRSGRIAEANIRVDEFADEAFIVACAEQEFTGKLDNNEWSVTKDKAFLLAEAHYLEKEATAPDEGWVEYWHDFAVQCRERSLPIRRFETR